MRTKTLCLLGGALLVALGLAALPLLAEEKPTDKDSLEVIYYYLPG